MTNVKLQVKFDMIMDNFDPNDSISVEDTNYEMHRNWRSFLRAGIDATQIAKMLSPEDLLMHYDELRSYGAEIDMTERSRDFEPSFIKKHRDELVKCGVDPKILD